MPSHADEYEFHADRERGVLLALFARQNGELYWSTEATEVQFDEPMPDDLFVYTPKLGEQICAAIPVVEQLTLAAAIARMPFTIFVPSRAPGFDPARLEFMYHPSRPKSPRPYLTLHFRGASREFLSIQQAAEEDPDLREYEWEHLHFNGQEVRISDPGSGHGYRLVAMKKQNTYLDICSDLDREQLMEVATSLAPANAPASR